MVPGGRARAKEACEHGEYGWTDQGALWPLKDSGLTLGEMGPTAGFEQRKEVI